MKRLILALVLAAAAVGFFAPRPATAAVPISHTVYREGGHPLRLTWTARVRQGENGSFSLYRRQSGRQVHVATLPAECSADPTTHDAERVRRVDDGVDGHRPDLCIDF